MGNATRCINATFWSPCTCDDIECSNGTHCIDECNKLQKSPACQARSLSCPQYDVAQCGTWCWNGLGKCPQCRAETCDVRPGAFCHGTPSCCKNDFAIEKAGVCGYVWVARSGVSVATTLSVLADRRSGLISSSTI